MKNFLRTQRWYQWNFILIVTALAFLYVGCTRTPNQQPEIVKPQASKILVAVNQGGPIVVTTRTAEFKILPSGYIHAGLLKGGATQSLDEAQAGDSAGSDYLVQDGKEVHFTLNFGQAMVNEASGKLGAGKQITISAQPQDNAAAGVQQTLQIWAYDDFPDLLLTSASYTNTGKSGYHIDEVVEQQHRFNSNEAKAHPYDMWSYQGASYDWGKEDVVKLTGNFSRPI